MDKDEIRSKIKARKSLLSDNEKRHASSNVFNKLEQSAAFLLAENILLYHSLPDELSTYEFLQKWNKKKHFFLPRETASILTYFHTTKAAWQWGLFI